MGAAADLAASCAGAGSAMDEAGEAEVEHAAAAAEARNARADQWEVSRKRGQAALREVAKGKAAGRRETRRREAARLQSQRSELQRSLARVSRPLPEAPRTPARGEGGAPLRGFPARDYARTFFHQSGSGPPPARGPPGGSVVRHERQDDAAPPPAPAHAAQRPARGRRLGKEEREAAARERGHAAMVRVQTGALCQVMEKELREMAAEERRAQAAALSGRLAGERLPSRVREGERQERLRAAFEGKGLLESDSDEGSDGDGDDGDAGALYITPSPEEDGSNESDEPDLRWTEPGAPSPRSSPGGGEERDEPVPEDLEPSGDGVDEDSGIGGSGEPSQSQHGAPGGHSGSIVEVSPRVAPPPKPVQRSPPRQHLPKQEPGPASKTPRTEIIAGVPGEASMHKLVPPPSTDLPSLRALSPEVSARAQGALPRHEAASKRTAATEAEKEGDRALSKKAAVIETLETMLTGLEGEGNCEAHVASVKIPAGVAEREQLLEREQIPSATQGSQLAADTTGKNAGQVDETGSFAFNVPTAEPHEDDKSDGSREDEEQKDASLSDQGSHPKPVDDVHSESGAPASHGTSRASELDDVESMLLELRNQVSALDTQLQNRKQRSTARRSARVPSIDEDAKISVKRALNSDFTSSSGLSDLSLLAEEGRVIADTETPDATGSSMATLEAERSALSLGMESAGTNRHVSSDGQDRGVSDTNTSSIVSSDLMRNVTMRTRADKHSAGAPIVDLSASSDISLAPSLSEVVPAHEYPEQSAHGSESLLPSSTSPTTGTNSTFPTSSTGGSFLSSLNVPERLASSEEGQGAASKESASNSSEISLPSLNTPEVLRTQQHEEVCAVDLCSMKASSDDLSSRGTREAISATVLENPSNVESFNQALEFLAAGIPEPDAAAGAQEDLSLLTKMYSAEDVRKGAAAPLSENRHRKGRTDRGNGSQSSPSKSQVSGKDSVMSEDWSPSFSKGDSLFNVSPSKSESPDVCGPRRGARLSGSSSLASSADSLMLSTLSQGNEEDLNKSLDDLSLYHTPLGTLDFTFKSTPNEGDGRDSARLPNRTVVSTMR